jgi:hydroxymethylpyrimidine kinase/phosphomethylpyrimidine kinase
MATAKRMPCALTIAGLDPGGGAGVAADLRAFTAAGAFGCAVVALLTVQSTSGLRETHPVRSHLVISQATDVVKHQRVRAIKTGALGSVGNVRALGAWLAKHQDIPVIVDPVLLPSAGVGRLLAARAVRALRDDLLPRASLVTANIQEAETLLGCRILSVGDAREAARGLVALGATAALVKGGHLENGKHAAEGLAVDVFALGSAVLELATRRLSLPPMHGGGCVFASLVAGRLATTQRGPLDARLLEAVRWARRMHQRALRAPTDVGGDRRVLVL